MTSHTDPELVTLAADGDQDAFAELVRRYRHAVYGYCYYRAGNFEDARDLCQETFILAYGNLRQLREQEKLGAWLRKIAANLCTRWYQQQREVPAEDVSSPPPAPESPRAAFVREALSGLPDKERLAVVMHYVDGLSYDEIAGFLETSVSAVKGRLYRGRDMLKREVLKMTQEAFGENKLDEEFVLKSARVAIKDSEKAFREQKDARLARKKADEAIEMLDQLGSSSRNVMNARMEALFAAAAVDDTDEHNALIDRADEIGLASGDPHTVASRLGSRAGGVFWRREWENGFVLLEQARAIALEDGDATLLAHFDHVEAQVSLIKGDWEAAKELYRLALNSRRALPSEGKLWEVRDLLFFEATIRALESFPAGLTAEDVPYFYASAGHFLMDEDEVSLRVLQPNDFARQDLVGLPGLYRCLPTFEISWPDVLLRFPARAGERWSTDFAHGASWYRLDSEIESDSDTVKIGLGTFQGCLRVVKRVTGSDQDIPKWPLGKWTVWFAPGVGIVKSIYEPEDGPIVTAELTESRIAGGEGHLPIEVGNRWRYKWVEGEESHGYRTEDYIEITTRHEETGAFMMQRYVTCVLR